MGGGHYIAYCRHAKRHNEWHEYDDSRVTPVGEDGVLAAEPYVLFYQRMPPPLAGLSLLGDASNNIERANLKRDYKETWNHFLNFLEKSHLPLNYENMATLFAKPPNEVGKVCFISKRWYIRARTMSSPGPLDTFAFLTPHGLVGCKDPYALVHKFIPIQEPQLNGLLDKYGGGPKLCFVDTCQLSLKWIEAYNERKRVEFELISRYDTKDVGDGDFWYLVDGDWVARWKR